VLGLKIEPTFGSTMSWLMIISTLALILELASGIATLFINYYFGVFVVCRVSRLQTSHGQEDPIIV
jgi:hypothetical protein